MTHKTIDRVDSEGNTGLHLACIQDNYELVHLILTSEKGKAFCSRVALNNQGLKAYECARSATIRQFFARPAST
jgi:ankyrin repeat protein